MEIVLFHRPNNPVSYDGTAWAVARGSLRQEAILAHRDRGIVWSGPVSFKQFIGTGGFDSACEFESSL